MSTVGLIPARGGSKRIPRKNIRTFHGRPLIEYAITTMLESKVFDRVVVSTDDDEIADVALAAGAEVPFRRPDELADDSTGTGAVIRHAISALESSSSDRIDELCLVYPGAVFVTTDDLSRSLAALRASDVQYVFSASTFAAPIERAMRIDGEGLAHMERPEHLLTRSQDLVEAYHDVGQFYWGRRNAWVDGVAVLAGRSKVHLIERWRVQDIDTPEDWQRAEILFDLLDRTVR